MNKIKSSLVLAIAIGLLCITWCNINIQVEKPVKNIKTNYSEIIYCHYH